MDTNGLVGKAERVGNLINRLGITTVLLIAFVGAFFYAVIVATNFFFVKWAVHDTKSDAIVTWTGKKLQFDLLDCIYKTRGDNLGVLLCDKAFRGEQIDMSEIKVLRKQ
jgi:hypothetical protein